MKISNKMHYIDLFIIPSRLYMFRPMFLPTIKHMTVFTVSGSVHPSCCRQPAATWLNTTRYSKYSQVLLMMGENIGRNM